MQEGSVKAQYEVKTESFSPRPQGRKFGIWALALLMLVASNYGIYSWQRSEVAKTQKSLNIANDKIKAAGAVLLSDSKTLNDLQKQYKTAQDKLSSLATTSTTEVSTLTQADLDLTVDGAITAHEAEYDMHLIGINLTLKNNTNSDITISPNLYTLKDSANHTFSYHQSGGGFGADYVPLANQTLAPGATVTGSIALTVADYTVTGYTLSIGTHNYRVTATKSDQEWPFN